jgi:hypothetical protein
MFKHNYKLYLSLIILYIFWTYTQYILATDLKANGIIIDRIHQSNLVENILHFLSENKDIARLNIIITTLLLEISIIYSLGVAIINNNLKIPYLLCVGIFFRQFCQSMTKFPVPDKMSHAWFDPNFPTIFMNYEVENDFFFSGHTLTALIIGGDFIEQNNIFYKIYGFFLIMYEILFVLLTRSHYFVDVYGAISTYFMIKYFYEKLESFIA